MASSGTLIEFLRKQRSEGEARRVDWDDVRREWLEALAALGQAISEWLQEPIREGLLEISPGSLELQEETLGRYVAPTWGIRAGSRVVSVIPVGRVIVGGRGRVDLRCGPRKLLLIRGEDGFWKIYERSERGLVNKGEELSGDTFSKAIRELLS